MIWLLLLVVWLGLHLGLRRRGSRSPQLIGHRGAAAHSPENTLSGLAKGQALGAQAVEIDFHRCLSGDLVVIHDATVDRTTNGVGPVAGLSLTHLKTLDSGSWFAPRYQGESLPTVAEMLSRADDLGIPLVLEMKAKEDYSVVAKQIADLLNASSQVEKHTVIAFSAQFLAELAKVRPQTPLGQLRVGNVWRRLPSHVNLVDVHWTVPLCDPTFLARMRAQGKKTWVWTVDNPGLGRVLYWLGIDGLTTNTPDRFRP